MADPFTGFQWAIHNGPHVDANWARFEAAMRERRACKAIARVAILIGELPEPVKLRRRAA